MGRNFFNTVNLSSMKRGRIEIRTSDDLNDIIQDMYNEFCDDFYGNDNLIRIASIEEIEESESIKEDTLILTKFGEYLSDKYLSRMHSIFCKYFPENEFEVMSYFMDFD